MKAIAIFFLFTLNQIAFSEELHTKINELNNKVLNLELAYDLGVEEYNYERELSILDDELIKFTISFNSLQTIDANSQYWNDSELLLLDVQNKLNALENRMKLEGDWGNISLKYNPIRKIDPNLKYRYSF